MSLNNIKIYSLLIFMLLCGIIARAQKTGFSALEIDKASRDAGNNLKDSVKSVRFFYMHYQEGLSKRDKMRVFYKNDARTSYQEFDKNGKITVKLLLLKDSINQSINYNIADRFVYDEKDRIEKSKYKIKTGQVFPAYTSYLIKINYVRLNRLIEDEPLEYDPEIYRYIFDKNDRILEEREYMPDAGRDTVIENPKEEDLYTRITFHYDARGNVIQQKIYAGEAGKSIGNFTAMNTEVGFCQDTGFKYTYDEQDRLIKVVLSGCGGVAESEEYTYDRTKKYITKINRYISGVSSFPSSTMVAHYNEFGDIVEMNFKVFQDKDDSSPPRKIIGVGEPINRYYEYDYDKHNNWIKCRMYLMGEKKEPTVIAERIIEYY
jgi:hypothetical protein